MSEVFDNRDRLVDQVDATLCVHGVGLDQGFWCGGCLNRVWRREYAPDSTVECVGDGCTMVGPCAAHRLV